MRGIVTFTTDFGLRDPFVAVLKGQVLRRSPDLQLVDITHEITRFQPAEAAFWLGRVSRYFPDGTVHLAVVDPGVGTARALVAVSAERQLFLAPDNGLLAAIAARAGAVARRIDLERLAGLGLVTSGGPTFHGRDLLAPVAAELAAGRWAFEALGEVTELAADGSLLPVVATATGWLGSVVTVDSFGNLFSNLEDQSHLISRDQVVSIRGLVLPWVATYGEARPGELVALVNSWGLVEIAQVQGNAAERLGAGRGEPVVLGSLPR
jgi:S-adenosylmethionine hydrolase